MRYFYFFILIFFTKTAQSQANRELIPFQKEGKWGYCDENLKTVIPPQFDDAYLFEKEVAIVIYSNIDTLWTDISSENVNYGTIKNFNLYNKQYKTVINSYGKKLIDPFIGEILVSDNFIICHFGHFNWIQQDSLDKQGNSIGIQVYTKYIEIDSSCVITKDGNILLPTRDGLYSKLTENCISWKKKAIDQYDESIDKQVEYYFNGQLFWTSSEKRNIPTIQCNDMCCYSSTDQSITIIGFDGKTKGVYTTEDTRSIEPIDLDKLYINQGDSYKIIDLKGQVAEQGQFWLNSLKEYDNIKSKCEQEKWRSPLTNKYRFHRKEIIFTSSNWTLTKSYEYNNEAFFYINREMPYVQFGPFAFVTSFYNGLAYVQELNSDLLIQIDEKGQKTGKNIPLNKVIFEVNNTIDWQQPTSYLKIKEQPKDQSGSFIYYQRADGKNFTVK